jgi:hypothetical protein
MIVKSLRQLDAIRVADRAVLNARAVRAGSLVTEPTDEQLAAFAVGGDNGKPCRCSDPTYPTYPTYPANNCNQPMGLPNCRPMDINSCYHRVAEELGCPMKVASGGDLGVVGGTIVTIRVQPTQSDYFLPVAVRLVVRDSTAPDILRFFLLTAVTVKNHPQENFHEVAPDATTVQGVDSSSYNTKTQGDQTLGVAVAWGPFSRTALADNLVLTGFSRYLPGVIIDARAEVHGYELERLPERWKCGVHPAAIAPASSPRPSATPVG